jgi:hypothetical protein
MWSQYIHPYVARVRLSMHARQSCCMCPYRGVFLAMFARKLALCTSMLSLYTRVRTRMFCLWCAQGWNPIYVQTWVHTCIHTYILQRYAQRDYWDLVSDFTCLGRVESCPRTQHAYIHAYIHTYIHTYICTGRLLGSDRWPLLHNKGSNPIRESWRGECMNTHTHTYICMYVCMYVCMCFWWVIFCVCAWVYLQTFEFMPVISNVVSVGTHIGMYIIYMYIYIYAYMYNIYIYIYNG